MTPAPCFRRTPTLERLIVSVTTVRPRPRAARVRNPSGRRLMSLLRTSEVLSYVQSAAHKPAWDGITRSVGGSSRCRKLRTAPSGARPMRPSRRPVGLSQFS
jgi:hypothetical protein